MYWYHHIPNSVLKYLILVGPEPLYYVRLSHLRSAERTSNKKLSSVPRTVYVFNNERLVHRWACSLIPYYMYMYIIYIYMLYGIQDPRYTLPYSPIRVLDHMKLKTMFTIGSHYCHSACTLLTVTHQNYTRYESYTSGFYD